MREECYISNKSGFSLLELMAVMLLMFIMMGIATTSFRGIMRGAGIRGAVATVRSVITQARQQAMNNGQLVAVILREEDGLGSMRTLMSFGRVANTVGNVIIAENELPWTAGTLAGAKIYNFGGAGVPGSVQSNNDISNSQVEFIVNGLAMGAGDEIAFEVGALRELPSGLRFNLAGGNAQIIVFRPDGSVESGDFFEVQERTSGAGYSISINAATGAITVGDL